MNLTNEKSKKCNNHAKRNNKALTGYVYELFYTTYIRSNGVRIDGHLAFYGISPRDGTQIFTLDFPDWEELLPGENNSSPTNCIRATIQDGEILFSLEDICYLAHIKNFRSMRVKLPKSMKVWLDRKTRNGKNKSELQNIKAISMKELQSMIESRSAIFIPESDNYEQNIQADGRASASLRVYRSKITHLSPTGEEYIKKSLTREDVIRWLTDEVFPTMEEIQQKGIGEKNKKVPTRRKSYNAGC